MINYTLLAFFLLLPLCLFSQSNWDNIITTENTEVFIDSTKMKIEDGQTFAYIKTIYTSAEARQTYVDKIKSVFKKNADKKIKKWNNFSYTITYGVYDCSKSRFKILEVEDFDTNNKRIVKTTTKIDKAPWTDIERETVGDYTIFAICDYDID